MNNQQFFIFFNTRFLSQKKKGNSSPATKRYFRINSSPETKRFFWINPREHFFRLKKQICTLKKEKILLAKF